ncbi:MAG: TonB family protein [Candidatus Oleimicrobiaceae bacterium]
MAASQMALPKEYRKSWVAEINWTFVVILLGSIVVHFGLMALLMSRPTPPEEAGAIDSAQARLATLVVRHSAPAKESALPKQAPSSLAEKEQPSVAGDVGAPHTSRAEGGSTAQVAGGSGPVGEAPLSPAHARTRERLAAEARATGVLRLLTSTSRASTGGGEVQALLGGEKAGADLDAVLGSIGGLKSTGQPAQQREVRGSRATEAGTIDTLVGELGTATSSTVARAGNLVVGPVTPLTREGEVTTQGGRDPDQVARVVNGHNDAIEYCYQKELRRNPALRGKLVVRFTINPQGKVSAVTIVSSTLNSPELENCILRRIQRWDDFGVVDASKGEATFRQVYTFGF